MQKEYESLRAEINSLLNLRHQMLTISITLFGLLLAFGTKEKLIGTVIFSIFPVINVFFVIGWTHYDFRIGEIGKYIRLEIEPFLPPMNWETNVHRHSKLPIEHFRGQEKTARGIFLGGNVLSAFIALSLMFINFRNELLALNNVALSSALLIFIILFITCIYSHFRLRSRRNLLYKDNERKKDSIKSLKIPIENIANDLLSSSNKKGYRKIIVTSVRNETEKEIKNEIWSKTEADEKTNVILHPNAELSYFNRFAKQDRHFHKYATEIYTMLEGSLSIELDNTTYNLIRGDSLIVFPLSVHKIKQNDNEDFICQVVSINSRGQLDKFIINDLE